jgi:hypothetical protein
MRNKMLLVGMIVVLGGLMTIAGFAQNRMMQRGAGMGAGTAASANLDIVTLSGKVKGASYAAGQGMPSLVLTTKDGDVAVMMGPYRAFADSKIAITPGSDLVIKAFADPRVPGAYVAVEISDTLGNTLVLRGSTGMPPRGMGQGMMRGGMQGGMGMMRGKQMGQGNCQGTCAYMQVPVDLKSKTTLTGTVVSIDMEPGKGSPSFVLQVGSAKDTIMACPYSALLAAGFTIAANDLLSVDAYPVPGQEGVYLAAVISNGKAKVQLRDENGVPLRKPGACAGMGR